MHGHAVLRDIGFTGGMIEEAQSRCRPHLMVCPLSGHLIEVANDRNGVGNCHPRPHHNHLSCGRFGHRINVVGISQYDPAAAGRPAWNAGRQVGAKRALKVRQIWSIRFFLDREGRMRDRALFDLAIDSKLRGCDLVKIKIGTLVAGPAIRTRSMVIQQKTGRPVQFEITSDTRASLLAWIERRGVSVDDFAFPSCVYPNDHLSTRQYARLVDEWVTAIRLTPEEYGAHSLRRTKASLIYKATGNLRAIQILLGHSKTENTVRYLGVDVDDALSLSEATEI
jgi:integrase